MHADLVEAARLLGINLPGLEKAAQNARKEIREFEEELHQAFPYGEVREADRGKVDVVVHGAHARGEVTEGSDFDYLVVTMGASPDTTRRLRRVVESVIREVGLKKPSGEGAFGTLAISAELFERIGLEQDTNVNTTRRILFLTESMSVYSIETRKHVVEEILSRYCADPPDRVPDDPAKVPRFLLNDLVRYWRTMAVDFGAKRWHALEDDYHLRLAKLRTTRKLLFTGPLATLLLVPVRGVNNEDLPGHLAVWLDKPPLAQLASITSELSDDAKAAMSNLLVEYDNFLELLHQEGVRETFKTPGTLEFDELDKKVDHIGNAIQESLELIFFDDPLLKFSTREYGLF